MSRMNEMWHGSLNDAKHYLEADTPTLEETQCALINAINHIQTLEAQIVHLQGQVAGIFQREAGCL